MCILNRMKAEACKAGWFAYAMQSLSRGGESWWRRPVSLVWMYCITMLMSALGQTVDSIWLQSWGQRTAGNLQAPPELQDQREWSGGGDSKKHCQQGPEISSESYPDFTRSCCCWWGGARCTGHWSLEPILVNWGHWLAHLPHCFSLSFFSPLLTLRSLWLVPSANLSPSYQGSNSCFGSGEAFPLLPVNSASEHGFYRTRTPYVRSHPQVPWALSVSPRVNTHFLSAWRTVKRLHNIKIKNNVLIMFLISDWYLDHVFFQIFLAKDILSTQLFPEYRFLFPFSFFFQFIIF